jgi:GNAT superfamily N-acetyltransferase
VIRYTSEIEDLTADRLTGFFDEWGTRPSPEMLLRALHGAEVAIVAIDDLTDRVVGFVTAIGDGVLSAYVPLLDVVPEYRGRGIGTELMRRVLFRIGPRYMIDLTCDEDVVPFYERLGMSPGRAMMLRDRGALTAAKEDDR